MAENYEMEIIAQPNIYTNKNRTIKLFFSEPEKGADKDTGMLLLLAGYGGSATSNVYAKMRRLFSDEYNLFTVQCDYFGYEYMQNSNPKVISTEMIKNTLSDAELDLLQRDYDKYSHILSGKIFFQNVDLNETRDSFNDMGLMQAIDNLRAMKVVIDIVESNGYKVNPNRVYAYGFSHGAYLAYLCNAFCPKMFTAIIDNSSYLTPYYLDHFRESAGLKDGIRIDQIISYKASEFLQDFEILNLPYLYEQFSNQSQIICFAGENDHMTPLEKKKDFLNHVEHTIVETITNSRIDKVCFHSTFHGMGADFVELFNYAYGKYLVSEKIKNKNRKAKFKYENVKYNTSTFHYEVRWENGIPMLYCEKII